MYRFAAALLACFIVFKTVLAAPSHLNGGSPLPSDMPFSAAVRHGDVLYLSGQIGVLPGTRNLAAGGIRPEAEQAIRNIESVLTANGATLSDLIRCTIMLADIAEWPEFNAVWTRMLEKPYPARSAFATNGLALAARVEIECTAAAQ